MNGPTPAPPIGGLTVADAAALMNVSVRGVERARRIARQAPDLQPMIAAGSMTICQAENIIKQRMGQRPDKLLEAVILAHTAINRIRQLAGSEYDDAFDQVYAVGEYLGRVRRLAVAEAVARKAAR